MEESGAVHLLIFPFPAQGHINPILQFSKRLIAKAPITVSLLTTLHVSKNLQFQGPYSNSVKIEIISDGSEDRQESDTLDETLGRFRRKMTANLADFIRKSMASKNPPRFLVYDSTMPWALDVAKEFRLDRAPFYTQSCALNSINYHVLTGVVKLPPETPTVSLPAMPLLKPSDLPAYDYDPASTDTIIELLTSQYSNIEEANLLLCNTFDKLEDGIIQWMESLGRPVKPIGPTLPSAYLDQRLTDDKHYGLSLFTPAEDACLTWLHTKPAASVLYVSYGSLVVMPEEQIHELALGLKQSAKPFLWIVRETEAQKLPPHFAESVAEQGLVMSWCPQLEVLAHAAVGCFVTHCGWNSTLEGLCLGVPMIGMPQWADQVTNAKFVEDVWKVGMRVAVDDGRVARREEIVRCIGEVMEGERGVEIRRNSMEWKRWAREAVDEGGSSDKNIQEFVSMLVKNT